MKLLVIGGTIFLGRHLVETALARGHEVTLFNRGQHNAHLFPGVEKLRGNRDGDLGALAGRTWDAVIDTCGYVPRVTRQSAEALADSAGSYTFISSISVYAAFDRPHMGENGPLGTLADPSTEQITGETYGPLKVLCEQTIEQALPGRALIIRPGLIVGPHDPTDRFTYWPARIARGGSVLVSGTPDQRLEYIDVRDLAEWNIRLIEDGKVGIYNATGPGEAVTMEMLLDVGRSVSGSNADYVYVPADFLKARDVEPNSVNFFYLAEEETAFKYIFDMDCGKAIGDGLVFRSLESTIRDTLDWSSSRQADYVWRAGLTAEKEQELLDAWANEPSQPQR